MNNLENLELIPMSMTELITVDAGHKGLAYDIGHAIGEGISGAITIAGCIALFFTPKS